MGSEVGWNGHSHLIRKRQRKEGGIFSLNLIFHCGRLLCSCVVVGGLSTIELNGG